MKLTLTLDFTSDWHIGTGSGRRGSAARLVRRDHDGLPFVPARALLGLWRDAAETLAQSLDWLPSPVGGTGWTALVGALFGTQSSQDGDASHAPHPGYVSLAPARLTPEALRRALIASPLLREGLTVLSPSVHIDPRTGAAEEDKLHFTEVTRAGAHLETAATITELPDADRDSALRFLAAAAEGIRAIGSKRRRGLGRVTVRVKEIPDATGAFFRDLAAPPALEPLLRPAVALFDTSASTPATPQCWGGWRLRLRALDPLQIQARTLGNVVETLDRVPGTLLLAALAPSLAAAGLDIARALGASDILFRDGLLGIEGSRGAPAPACLQRDKYRPADERTRREDLRCRWISSPQEFTQPQGLRGGYVSLVPDNGVVPYGRITPISVTHNVIDDALQRPTEAVGGVYTYEAIPPETELVAEVLARGNAREAMARVIQSVNGKELRLGRALHADYGRVHVQVEELHVASNVPATAGQLTILLMSPLLLRDRALRPTVEPDALRVALEDRLNVKLKFEVGDARPVRIDSWQRSWGLPRPSLVGLAAGSAFRFEITEGTPSPAELTRLAVEGLGERTAEGFGELAVNPLVLTTTVRHLQHPLASTSAPQIPSLAELSTTDFGAVVLKSSARAALSRAIASVPLPKEFQPKANEQLRAQIGALRDEVSRARTGGAADAALGWARRRPKDGTPRAPRVREWVLKHLGDDVWAFLAQTPSAGESIRWLESCPADLRKELSDEGWLALIERFAQEGARSARAGREVQYGS